MYATAGPEMDRQCRAYNRPTRVLCAPQEKPREFWAGPGAGEDEDEDGDSARPRQKPIPFGEPGFYSIDSLESQFSF